MNFVQERLLAADTNRAAIIQKTFFGMIWAFLASTTALFGYANLGPVFLDFLQPLTPFNAATLSNWMGAIMAMSFLDIGYLGWNYLALNRAETVLQLWTSKAMKWIALAGSIAFTVIVLWLILDSSEAATEWSRAAGKFIFLGVSSLYALAMMVFMDNSFQTRGKNSTVKVQSKANDEKLAFDQKVKIDGLIDAATQADTVSPVLASLFTTQWTEEMVNNLLDSVPDESVREAMKAQYESMKSQPAPVEETEPAPNGFGPFIFRRPDEQQPEPATNGNGHVLSDEYYQETLSRAKKAAMLGASKERVDKFVRDRGGLKPAPNGHQDTPLPK